MTATAINLSKVRSVLSVPGHDSRKVAGARSRGADLIMWDLEDSVPVDRKAEARALVAKVARPGDCIRVNGVRSVDFADDLAMARSRCILVMVPKVEVDQLPQVDGRILSIESPSAVLAAAEIAKHSCGIAFGRYDLMAACGISDIWSPLVDHAMVQVALAAFAAGVPVSEAPCYSLTDDGLLEREIERARSYGFTSKCCIHPRQIAACAVFGPSPQDLSRDSEVLAQWQPNKPISVANGRMLGPPDMRRALRSATAAQ